MRDDPDFPQASLGRAGPPPGARFHGAALAPPCAGAAVHGRGGRQHGAARLAHGAGARPHLHREGFVAAAADRRRRAGAGACQIAGRLRPDRADEPGRPARHHRCADRDVRPPDSQRSGVFPCPPERHADLALHERRLAAAQRGGQCAGRDRQGRADRRLPCRRDVLSGLVDGARRLYRLAAGDPAGRADRPPHAARIGQHSGRAGPADDAAEPDLPGRPARQGLWDGGIRAAPRGFPVRAHLSTDRPRHPHAGPRRADDRRARRRGDRAGDLLRRPPGHRRREHARRVLLVHHGAAARLSAGEKPGQPERLAAGGAGRGAAGFRGARPRTRDPRRAGRAARCGFAGARCASRRCASAISPARWRSTGFR